MTKVARAVWEKLEQLDFLPKNNTQRIQGNEDLIFVTKKFYQVVNFLSIFRAFFIAIFRHIHYIGARACHRTALEFCKLALSLDPLEDPLGILLMMDFYALILS